MKFRVLFLSILLAVVTAAAGAALGSVPATANAAAGGLTLKTASGTTFAVDKADPITLTRDGERNGKTTYTEASAAELTGKIVAYTGNFYKMDSYERAGETVREYAIRVEGNTHIVSAVYESGSNEIPVPGYLLSIPSTVAGYDSLAVDDKLTATGSIDLPSFTIDNLTKRLRVVALYQNVRTNSGVGIVFYGEDFGTSSKQNEWNTEVSFEMIRDGENVGNFSVGAFTEGGKGTIPSPGFLLAAHVGRADAPSENAAAAYGMLLEGAAFSKGDVCRMSGKDYLGLEFSATMAYDYKDPTKASNPLGAGYPECRGTDQVIIYTHSLDGGNKLSTNIYGYEAAVDKNNIVIDVGVNVVDIPEGGFVFSAHGVWADTVRNNFRIGATVTVNEDNMTVTVENTVLTAQKNLEDTAAALRKTTQDYEDRLYDIDTTNIWPLVEQYEALVKEVKDDLVPSLQAHEGAWTKEINDKQVKFKQDILACDELADRITILSVEARAVDGRAAWHSPQAYDYSTEPDLESMRHDLDIIADAGVDTLFVEMLREASTIYNSEYFPYDSRLAANTYEGYEDYMHAFVAECKQRGIAVHAWVTVFMASGTMTEDKATWPQLCKDHPDWLVKNRKGNHDQPNYEKTYFWDPANPEYRAFFIDYCKELYEEFPDLAGLNLDYIRYDWTYNGDDKETMVDSGYTLVAMKNFLDEEGMTLPGYARNDEVLLRDEFVEWVDADDDRFERWVKFRQDQVTAMVKGIHDMSRAYDPEKMISTATAAEYESGQRNLFQDWYLWVKNGWIDICTPMAYLGSAEAVQGNTEQALIAINNMSYNFVGIGPYMGWDPIDYIEQISACYNAGAMGYSLFASYNLFQEPKAVEALKSAATKHKSVSSVAPVADVLKAYFDMTLDRAERLWIAGDQMTREQFDALKAEFERIEALPTDTSAQLLVVKDAVQAIVDEPDRYALRYAQQRLQDNLALLLTNLDIKLSRKMILSGEWDTSKSSVRPVPEGYGGGTPSEQPSKPPVAPTAPAGGKKGCGGSIVAGGLGALLLLAAGCALGGKRRKA